MPDLETLPEMQVLNLNPFCRQMKECPKCGYGLWRLPAFIVRWLELPHTHFHVGFCKGGQEPGCSDTLSARC
jgi:hypothetical protein